jgi:hypothetical protein
MAKFSGVAKVAPPRGPLTTAQPSVTHEGGTGFAKDAKTELFTLAVTNMVNETTFYESADARQDRFVYLVQKVTLEDPAWVAAFVPWLRNEANMRSAAVVVAVEYVRAGGANGRTVINSACSRADEPAEVIGYWLSHYGRRIPMAIKRGVADAAADLYNERNALKYDGGARGIRMGDVIELTHPKPAGPAQSMLFRHLLDRRHGHWVNDGDDVLALQAIGLKTLAKAYNVDAVAPPARRQFLADFHEIVLDAGYTWERLSGWLPGGMDAAAWESIIPAMGYMALLRNLRNFEQAGVDKAVLTQVADKIADPEAVVHSRQFPYRFWSAYRNSGTTFFAAAIEAALELSVKNIPVFSGRTLVAIDTSASMNTVVSSRSKVRNVEIGALFGAAVGAQSSVDLMIYANHGKKVTHRPISVLRTVEGIVNSIGVVGHGTETWPSVIDHYDGQDRIIVFTDMQDHPAQMTSYNAFYHREVRSLTLPDVPVYVWDLAGHGVANVDTMTPGRYLMSGFNDSAFKLVGLLEAGLQATWPWENE